MVPFFAEGTRLGGNELSLFGSHFSTEMEYDSQFLRLVLIRIAERPCAVLLPREMFNLFKIMENSSSKRHIKYIEIRTVFLWIVKIVISVALMLLLCIRSTFVFSESVIFHHPSRG